jgi:chloride channel protein, CIC family
MHFGHPYANLPSVDDPSATSAQEPTIEQANELIRSRSFIGLLVLASIVGVVVSIAAWCFLEGTYQLQRLLFETFPEQLGSKDPPFWYLLILLSLAGLIVGLAIDRFPGRGGHVPADGLQTGGATPQGLTLIGVVVAGVATIGLGFVLGPEAPLLALGSGLGVALVRSARKDTPEQALMVVAAAGSFAAVSFLFTSPIIAAVIVIEAAGIGGVKQRIVLLPGLLAAGIGSLVSIGIGSLSGLSSSDYSLGALQLPQFDQPTLPEFAWTIPLAIVVAIGAQLVLGLGRRTEGAAKRRPVPVAVSAGVLIACFAALFKLTTDQSPVAVLLSGQDALPDLAAHANDWATGTLLLLLLFKGLAYGLSLGSFRGGPTFPALFLGAAAGIIAADLPGMSTTPAVAVCMAAATVSVLGLPLASSLVVILLTASSGPGAMALVIVAVVVADVFMLTIDGRRRVAPSSPQKPAAA